MSRQIMFRSQHTEIIPQLFFFGKVKTNFCILALCTHKHILSPINTITNIIASPNFKLAKSVLAKKYKQFKVTSNS